MDCGVLTVLHIHCTSYDKVVIFLPWVDYEDAFTLTLAAVRESAVHDILYLYLGTLE